MKSIHHRWRKRNSLNALFAAICLLASIQGSSGQKPGDESATLAIIARTDTDAYLIVDSGVTNSGLLISDPQRKQFDVADKASCALAGHLGFTPMGSDAHLFDIASSLRNWVKKHPLASIQQQMPYFARIAAQTLKEEIQYRHSNNLEMLPSTAGTDILCVSFAEKKPLLLNGWTVIQKKGQDDSPQDVQYFWGSPNTVLLLRGSMPEQDLLGRGTQEAAFIQHFFPTASEKIALNHFRQAYTSGDASKWDSDDVRAVLFPLYLQVEEDTIEHALRNENIGVGGPNIVRKFNSRGMSAPNFADPIW